MDRHYISLELDKILQRLSTFAGSFDAKETILALEPQTDLDDVQRLQQQTVDAHMLMARFGGPSFGGLKNVNNALSRANAGSVLSMRELLDVAGVLRTIRAISEWRDSNAGVVCSIDIYFDALTPNK